MNPNPTLWFIFRVMRFLPVALAAAVLAACGSSGASGGGGGGGAAAAAATPPAWQTAGAVEAILNPATAPKIASIGTNKYLAVWLHDNGAAVLDVYTSLFNGTAWGAPAVLDGLAVSAATPEIAADGQGNAIAVWVQNSAGFDHIYAARYDGVGAVWSAALQVDWTNTTENAAAPHLAYDASGYAIVVWQQGTTPLRNIWASQYWAGWGLPWTAPLTLDTLAGDVQNPRIAMDGTGKAMVLWEQVDTDLVFSIYALKYAPASGWEVTPKLVETLKPVAGNPRLVMDTAGNVTAVWEQGGSIFSSYYTYATAVWSIPVLLENTNGTAANPELALASTGDVFAVWYDVDSTGLIFSVYTNSLTKATGLWGAATVISTITPGFAVGTSFLPQVATDASGAAVAVWQHPTALGINNTFTSRYTAAAGWGAATALQTTSLTLTGDTPRAAMDGAGNAMAVWQQDDLTQTNIMARQYK